jgi:hypothetical protein
VSARRCPSVALLGAATGRSTLGPRQHGVIAAWLSVRTLRCVD